MLTDLLTHTSAHLSGLCFCAALAMRLNLSQDRGLRGVAALWTAGCGLLWIHTAAVWFLIHDGHWGAAWEHTARETAAATGIPTGIGLVFNFVTLALWSVDCVWWLNRPRPPATGAATPPNSQPNPPWGTRRWRRPVDAYLAFMWFQAAVVFPHSAVRWVGLAATIGLLLLAALRR